MDNTLSTYFRSASQENGVLIPQFAGDLRAEVMTDSIIPDTMADIEKVLLTTASPKIDGYYVTDDSLDIEGNVTYRVLLLTEGGELATLTVTEPLSIKQELTAPFTDYRAILLPALDYASARLVNPRKLNLRSQTTIATRLFSCLSPNPVISGTESLDDDMNIQRCYRSIHTVDVTSCEEANIAVSQDVELDSNAPEASEILTYRVTLRPTEVRLRGDEADVRTEADLSLLYRTDGGNAFAFNKKFALERTLSIPRLENAEWLATAAPGNISAHIASNAYGENKVIELDFPYDLSLVAISGKTTEAATDMYSTEFECDTVYHTLPVLKLQRMYTTNVTINASAERSATGCEAVRSLLDGFITLQDRTVNYQEDKKKLIVEGSAIISLLGENHAVEGSDPPYTPITFPYPFRCEIDAGAVPAAGGDYILDCQLANSKLRTDSEHLYADLEFSIRLMVLEAVPFSCLKSLKLDRTLPVKGQNTPFTLCYPSGNETLWDIAKYYKIAEDSIRLSNGISNEDIGDRKVLLIPRTQPKKAVFSKVI